MPPRIRRDIGPTKRHASAMHQPIPSRASRKSLQEEARTVHLRRPPSALGHAQLPHIVRREPSPEPWTNAPAQRQSQVPSAPKQRAPSATLTSLGTTTRVQPPPILADTPGARLTRISPSLITNQSSVLNANQQIDAQTQISSNAAITRHLPPRLLSMTSRRTQIPGGQPSLHAQTNTFFHSRSRRISPVVQDLNNIVNQRHPFLLDDSVSSRLITRISPYTGRGIFVADQARFAPGEPIGVYYGDVFDGQPPQTDYILAVPTFRHNGVTYNLSVDAHNLVSSGTPHPSIIALWNHTCKSESVRLRWQHDQVIPYALAFATDLTTSGKEIVWNYDAGSPRGGFTLGFKDVADATRVGFATFPCRCADPCPRNRWFKSWRPS